MPGRPRKPTQVKRVRGRGVESLGVSSRDRKGQVLIDTTKIEEGGKNA
jgi:hypothetical protein